MVQSGLCHNRSTALLDHVLDTSMQFLKSTLALSFAKQAMSSSEGRRLTGGILCSRSCEGDMVMSLREATPSEDCESLRWVVKKSVSS